MSNNLDKALEEILNDTYSAGAQDPDLEMYGVNDSDVTAIKQTFIDDGWLKVEYSPHRKYESLITYEEWQRQAIKDGWVKIPNAHMTKEGWISVSTDKGVRFGDVPLMPGNVWFDRFEKLVDEMNMEPPVVDGAYLEAAKKASGIS